MNPSTDTNPIWYEKWLVRNNLSVNKPILSTNPQENTITLAAGPTEMLRITEDGFYVRGVKVAQDDKEAEEVYNCFKEWLNWNILQGK